MPQVQQILNAIDDLAPWGLAESWDRVGLQIGSTSQPVHKIMVSLDINQQVIQEGIEQQVDGFVVHHPLIFKPLTQIDSNSPIGDCISTLIKHDFFLIAAHTNADKAENGLNQNLADQFNLSEIEPLEPVSTQDYKIVVFTPVEYLDKIRMAMAEAGAGIIGEYTICSFEQTGVGTFQPNDTAQPFIGRPGQFTTTPEIRLEMVTSARNLSEILKVISLNHPYDQPVMDVYPLLCSSRHGMGRMGNLKTTTTFRDLCLVVQEKLSAKDIRVIGSPDRLIKRVAICSGSGGSLIPTVIKKRADVYITGELGYHDFLTARDNELMIIEAGHWTTEHCFIALISNYLKQFFAPGKNLEVAVSNTMQTEPYLTIML
jgi:dinuclear metal center YbgI/SA1388 family protein